MAQGGDSGTPSIQFGINRNRRDTGLGTMSSTPDPRRELQALQRDYQRLEQQIRDTTAQIQNSPQNRRQPGYEKPLVRPVTYDGKDPWEDYVVQFELVSEMNGWNNDQKAMFLVSSLRGKAQGILTDLEPEHRKSYLELSRALNRRFGSENRMELFRVQLKNMSHRRDQSLPELAQAVKHLSRKTYPSAPPDFLEILCRDHFIDALTDSDMRLRIQQGHPKTLDDATKLAVELDAFNLAEKHRDKKGGSTLRNVSLNHESTQNNFQGNDVKSFIADVSSELKSMRKEIDFLRKNSGKSFSRKDGPKPPRPRACWKCGSTDHLKRDCKSDENERPRLSRVAKDGCGMYVTGYIHGLEEPITFPVDTGASVSIVNTRVFRKIPSRPTIKPANSPRKMADGKCMSEDATSGIAEVKITLENTAVKHEVWVVDIDDEIDGILGFDFLK